MWLPKRGHKRHCNFCLAPTWATHSSCCYRTCRNRYTADDDLNGVNLHIAHSDNIWRVFKLYPSTWLVTNIFIHMFTFIWKHLSVQNSITVKKWWHSKFLYGKMTKQTVVYRPKRAQSTTSSSALRNTVFLDNRYCQKNRSCGQKVQEALLKMWTFYLSPNVRHYDLKSVRYYKRM